MGRKSSKEMVTLILKALEKEPKTTYEISKDIDSNWDSVKDYLKALETAGIVRNQEGNKFYLSMNATNKNVYFGFYLDSARERKINSLFAAIKGEWINQTKTSPTKTHVQKTLVEVVKQHPEELGDVPIGWYLYGAFCVKSYEPEMDYGVDGLTKEILETISGTVKKFHKMKATELQRHQHKNNPIYAAKDLLIDSFEEEPWNKKLILDILEEILSLSPHTDRVSSKEAINEFYATISMLFAKLEYAELKQVKQQIMTTTAEWWKLIALHGFFKDMKKYFEPQVVELQMFPDIELQEMVVLEKLAELEDHIPEEPEPTGPIADELKRIQKLARELSPKEQEQKRRELEKMSEEDLFRKLRHN